MCSKHLGILSGQPTYHNIFNPLKAASRFFKKKSCRNSSTLWCHGSSKLVRGRITPWYVHSMDVKRVNHLAFLFSFMQNPCWKWPSSHRTHRYTCTCDTVVERFGLAHPHSSSSLWPSFPYPAPLLPILSRFLLLPSPRLSFPSPSLPSSIPSPRLCCQTHHSSVNLHGHLVISVGYKQSLNSIQRDASQASVVDLCNATEIIKDGSYTDLWVLKT